MSINLFVANETHVPYAQEVCDMIEESAKVRGTGIAKREMPGVELFAIKSPEDIDTAQSFVNKHAKINK